MGKKSLVMLDPHLRDRKVDYCGVLFHKEVVLGESFNAKDEIWRQFGQLEPFEEVLLVGFVFLNVNETYIIKSMILQPVLAFE